jgi:hypothetical protein
MQNARCVQVHLGSDGLTVASLFGELALALNTH